jgi:hypothetical protein
LYVPQAALNCTPELAPRFFIVFVYALTKFRIISCGDESFLIFTITPDDSWTLYSKTLHTPDGDIHLKAFTEVSYGSGYLQEISNKKRNMKHNLVFKGNKLNEDLWWVALSPRGRLWESYSRSPQKFIFEGVEFEVFSYRFSSTGDICILEIVNFSEIVLRGRDEDTVGNAYKVLYAGIA